MRKPTRIHFLVRLISFFSFLFLLLINGYSQSALRLDHISINSLHNLSRLTAKVTDKEGYPIPGVEVTLINAYGISRSILTDSNGSFQFDIDRGFWTPSITITLVLQGFATSTISNIDIPYPGPEIPPPPPPEADCKIHRSVLTNKECITFIDGKVSHINQVESYDVCFKDEKFYVMKGKGGINTVGDQGKKSLCGINYPSSGYRDSFKIIKNHVYLYESYTNDILVEIRVKSFVKNTVVRINYHVRKDE